MSKHIEELTQSILIKKKHAFNWSFILVFTGPILAASTLFFMSITGHTNPASWVNWFMFLVFVPLILVSLIIGQKRELVGSYGETILLLIPTFVWLLPGHEHALKTMIIMAFIVVVIGFLIYSSANILRHVKHKNDETNKKIANILLRIGFVASTVTSTVIISIILLDWADHSLHIADKKMPNGEILTDYTVTGWIVFISTVTILDALTLVVLGLITGMKESHMKTFNTQEFGYTKSKKGNTPTKKLNIVEKTMIIDLKKHNKRK